LKKQEKKNDDNEVSAKKWKEQSEELEGQIKELSEKLTEAVNESTAQKQEVDVLKDCLLQFKVRVLALLCIRVRDVCFRVPC